VACRPTRRVVYGAAAMTPVLRSAVFLLLLFGAVAAVHASTGTPLVILLAALLPALAYAALFTWIARRLQCRVHVLEAIFVGGAVIAAGLSVIASDLLHVWFTAQLGEQAVHDLTPAFGAPVVEEASKALALLLVTSLRGRPSSVVDGILCGACVGIGFAMIENVGYFTLAVVQGGPLGLVRSVYLRGLVEGLNHASFTGAVGAGLAFARGATSVRARIGAPVAGFAAAVLQHVIWNLVASNAVMDVLCDPPIAGGSCRGAPTPLALFATVPLIVTLAIGPGVSALLVVAVRTSRGARRNAVVGARERRTPGHFDAQ